MIAQAYVLVIGDVIGVGFRAWTKIQSKATKTTGWVRNVYNKPDIFGPQGGVEVVVQGEKNAVEDMIDHIREGSGISRVEHVEVLYQEPKEIFEEFSIYKSESFLHR